MAVENFLDEAWVEIDPNSHITKTSSRVTFASLTCNEDAYVYKDKGAGHFSGDFEHLLDICIDSVSSGQCGAWTLANVINDIDGVAAGDGLLAFVQPSRVLTIYEFVGGDAWWISSAGPLSLDTTYYLKIKRDEAVGTYGTLYCYIYPTANDRTNGTNIIETIQLTLHEKEDFRYIYGVQSYADWSGGSISGYIENLDLQEGGGVTAKTSSETGAGADAKESYPSGTLESSEAGAGADAKVTGNPLAALARLDSGSGACAVAGLAIAKASAEAGAGTEAASLVKAFPATDTGLGSDLITAKIERPTRGGGMKLWI